MNILGIAFGLLAALLLGAADSMATLAARHLSTFKVTFLSQAVTTLLLLCVGILVYGFWRQPLSLTGIAWSGIIGVGTGLCASLGYSALYRALATGPIVLVSPLVATSSIITLGLTALLLHQFLSGSQLIAVTFIIGGIVLAMMRVMNIRSFLTRITFSSGIRWAIAATFAFGCLDFGIGTAASFSDWFLPVWWTRLFSLLFLALFSWGKGRYRAACRQKSQLAELSAEEKPGPSVVSPGSSLLAPLSLARKGFDPEATLIRKRIHTVSTRSSSSLVLLLEQRFDPEETLIAPTSQTRRALAMQAARVHREEVSAIPTCSLSREPVTSSQLLADAHHTRTDMRSSSYSLPRLDELKQLCRPLASSQGLALLLAVGAGMAEQGAILLFSFNTLIAGTGIAAVIVSSSVLLMLLFGIVVSRERLERQQVLGLGLFLGGLLVLSF